MLPAHVAQRSTPHYMTDRRSSGKGGNARGRTARRTNSNGESSAADRLACSTPQPMQRWINTHSPDPRTVIAIGSMPEPQSSSMARSPGRSSTWRDHRQVGQWLRCSVPGASDGTSRRQLTQRKELGWRRGPYRSRLVVGERLKRCLQDRWWRDERIGATHIGPGMQEDRPGGRSSRALEASELAGRPHPEVRRAKDRPCGL